jgi:glycerol-3-phosphate dehydrogenase (NAD(P)+)
MTTRFTVIGDGAMGTACANILSHNADQQATIWCQFDENCQSINQHRENVTFLPGVTLADSVRVVSDFNACSDADAFIVAVPTPYLRDTLSRLADLWPKEPPIVSVVKGMEQKTFESPSQIITEVLGERSIAALSGPSHAEESLADCRPASWRPAAIGDCPSRSSSGFQPIAFGSTARTICWEPNCAER